MQLMSDRMAKENSCHRRIGIFKANFGALRALMLAIVLCLVGPYSTGAALDYYADQDYVFTATPKIPGYIYLWTVTPSVGTPTTLGPGADLDSFQWTAPPDGQTVTITVLVSDNFIGSCIDEKSLEIEVKDLANLGNRVWEDLNYNGIQDAGEPGVAGVTVNLLKADGTSTGLSTTTLADGKYSFTGLIPGDYMVEFVPSTLPPGYLFTLPNQGSDDSIDSDADTTTGRTASTTLDPGETDDTWDAGIYRLASLSDYVWLDSNNNGIQDSGETGKDSVTVELYDSSGNLLKSTTTDASGLYQFTGLLPGDYKVKFSLPTCFFFTAKDQGTNDATDSDADASSGETIFTNLISGENDDTWDAGLVAYDPKIAVDKTADKVQANVGETITYTFTVTNTGNVPLAGVAINDDKVQGITGPAAGEDANGDSKLDLTETWTFTGTYVVALTDICGDIVNTATAKATDPCDPAKFVVSAPDSVTVNAQHTASLVVDKTADKTQANVGETITYTFTVTNTGNVPLAAVTIEDNKVQGITGPAAGGDANNNGKLDTTETWTYTGTYVVQLTDICGDIVNTATAKATDPCNPEGKIESLPDSVTVNALHTASLKLDKTADKTEANIGETITYTFTVTNTGNVPLAGVTIEDNKVQGITGPAGDANNNGKLDTTETWTYTGTYVVQLADICGYILNMAKASATDPCNPEVRIASPEDFILVKVLHTASLKLDKTADKTEASPGDTITYAFTVTNTGNVPLAGVAIEDHKVQGITGPVGDANNDGKLDLTETWTYTGTYVVQLADICGDIVNTAKASADEPCDEILRGPSPAGGKSPETNQEGRIVSPEDSVTVKVLHVASLDVDKTADKTEAKLGDTITYTFTVTNTGNVPLAGVAIEDDKIQGITGPAGDANNDGKLDTTETWTYTGTYVVQLTDICSDIVNKAKASAADPCNPEARIESEEDSVTVKSQYTASLALDKTADKTEAYLGDTITYTFTVTNTGDIPLAGVAIDDDNDKVQDITGPVGDENNDGKLDTTETWTYTGTYVANSCEDIVNTARASATNPCDPESSIESPPDTITVDILCECLELTKTALNETVERGQDIYYNIELCSKCNFDQVILRDVLPADVELVSVDPPASLSGYTLTWDLGPVSPYQRCFNAVVVVRVPLVNMSYDMEQGVQGEGFVNIHNDYDTHHEPKSITNCAYAEAYVANPNANLEDNLDDNLRLLESVSSCASSRVVDPGTELRRREFGSGTYASEELTRVRMENKSIQSATSLSASHKPTTFSLPGGSSITYGSKWTEKSKGINYATGATMTEEYTFANKIDKERVLDLDKNGSTMKTDVSFTGTGHIGVLKKDEPDSHPKVKPTYEATEDYTGSFQVNEMVDEYGSNVRSDKSVTGYGYAAVDKRVSNNQRTYESGTGSYQSDEKIETASNYIAKDINLVYGPTNYSYSPSFATNQNIKWSEGMWSKSGVLAGGAILAALPTSGCGGEAPANTSAPATYISERYSSLNYLDKETVAASLNEMKTNASFSGMADFRAKATYSNKTGEIDNEERYVGEYDITRKVQLTGVSKYGRPHITVTKEGNMTTRWFNKTMANVAEYTITIVNDGNVALAPIHIRDIFPPGTEYIYSSIRPESYTNSEANWSLMNLGVGNSIQLELTLNVTEYAPANLVNRVMVCGINSDEGCVSGSAYFVLESGDLSCCPPEVVLDKVAQIDATDQTLIHYTIVVQNNANSTVAATLTDMLPIGMNYMSATNEPDIQSGQFLQWIIPTLEPGDVTTIEYQARATMNGAYVNEVHMDATAVDGTGYDIEDAAARIYIGSTGVPPKTTRYGGWQVPDWNMTSSEQGITVSLSPDEDSAAEFPTMYS